MEGGGCQYLSQAKSQRARQAELLWRMQQTRQRERDSRAHERRERFALRVLQGVEQLQVCEDEEWEGGVVPEEAAVERQRGAVSGESDALAAALMEEERVSGGASGHVPACRKQRGEKWGLGVEGGHDEVVEEEKLEEEEEKEEEGGGEEGDPSSLIAYSKRGRGGTHVAQKRVQRTRAAATLSPQHLVFENMHRWRHLCT